jgi:hypothetical protein
MKSLTKIQITTLITLFIYALWEYMVSVWAQSQVGPIIRVDLIIFYPLLLVLISISIYQRYQ